MNIFLEILLKQNKRSACKKSKLDFDNAYQFEVALSHHLEIVTMDRDF